MFARQLLSTKLRFLIAVMNLSVRLNQHPIATLQNGSDLRCVKLKYNVTSDCESVFRLIL